MSKNFKTDEERYSIDKNGCWVWKLAVSYNGYPMKNGKRALNHFFAKHRGVKKEGMVFDHLCRNRRCVNPYHIEEVTPAENVRRGLLAKLQKDDVIQIRDMYKCGEQQAKIADFFGITQSHVSRLVNMEVWAIIN